MSTMAGTERIEQGWYNDPSGEPVVRFHDGNAWTEKTQSVERRMAEEQIELLRTLAEKAASIQAMVGVLVFIAVAGLVGAVIALLNASGK